MAVEYVNSGNDDGSNFGLSTTDKIGFYGLTTPIVQPTGIITATDAATAITGAASCAAALIALNIAVA